MILATEPYCCFLMYEDYIYHTLAAKASGELCMKYIFSFGAFARKPLLQRSAPLSDLLSTNELFALVILTACTVVTFPRPTHRSDNISLFLLFI